MRSPPDAPGLPAPVMPAAQLRIVGALAHRSRYRYVQPLVLAEDGGWVVVSPNCSRNVDPQGGDIAIAWLLPEPGTAPEADSWRLHVRDHGLAVWRLKASGLTLDAALAQICTDPLREFWP